MIGRFVTLGNGRRVALGAYVRAWRRCVEIEPNTWLPLCPDGWSGVAADALRQFRVGMQDRINRHDPGYGRGRKWQPDWQRETLQTAGAVNTPRLAIHWLPEHLKARFAHRLRSNMEC